MKKSTILIVCGLIITAVVAAFGVIEARNQSASIFKFLNLQKSENVKQQDTENIDISEYQTYQHTDPSFSFQYPGDFSVTSIPDEYGEVILVKNPKAEKQEFQIFIGEFDEPGPITPERIKKDMPELLIEEPSS